MTDHEPRWRRDQRARSASTAQLVRGQISTLDDDTLFWLEFDSTGEPAFNRILARKVGDANSYEVQLSWMSMFGQGELHWKAERAPYPPSDCNPTMRTIPIEPDRQAGLAILAHHEQWDALRVMCEQLHTEALLSRAARSLT